MSRSGTRLTYPMSVVCPFSSVGSTSRCNTGVKPLRWGFECQSLTWPFVELTSRSPRRKATQLRLDGRMEMKNVKSGTQVGRAAGSAPCLRRNLPWCLLRLTVYPMRYQQRDLGTGALTEMRAARGCRLLGCVGPKWTTAATIGAVAALQISLFGDDDRADTVCHRHAPLISISHPTTEIGYFIYAPHAVATNTSARPQANF